MNGGYRIFGSEMSPYSVKVRSYFRYKGLPHVWIPRRAENDEDYRRYTKLPLIPLVVTPQGEGIQDSTPIIEALEAKHPAPSIHPDEAALGFLSALVEEFGDEWGNKLMFHHRWYDPVDQNAASLVLARLSLPFGEKASVEARAGAIKARMTGRGGFVGSSDATAPLITAYYLELLDILEPHLLDRPYLFGARPAFGDFGLAPQLYEASVDPTCGAMETWAELAPTLSPLIAYIGRYFLPWTRANARALAAGEAEFGVELPGGAYAQAPQKYHAKSLAVLQSRYAAVSGNPALTAILSSCACDLTG